MQVDQFQLLLNYRHTSNCCWASK